MPASVISENDPAFRVHVQETQASWLAQQMENFPVVNVAAEVGILGSVLVSPPLIEPLAAVLIPEDFSLPLNQALWRDMLAIHAAGDRPDYLTCSEAFARRGELAAVENGGYLLELVAETPTPFNDGSWTTLVLGCAERRAAQAIGEAIVRGAPHDDLLELKAHAIAGLERLQRVRTKEQRTKDDILSTLFDKYTNPAAESDALATGFPDLDAKLDGGFRPGELILVAARPGVGKSAFACTIAYHVAVRHQLPVAIFSAEMTQEQTFLRIASMASSVPLRHIRSHSMSDAEMGRYAEAVARLHQSPLFIEKAVDMTIGQIRAQARKLHEDHGLRLTILDYIQKVKPDHHYENPIHAISEVVTEAKAMAQDLMVPNLCPTQLNREPEKRASGDALISELRGSGSLEQEADIITILQRDSVRTGAVCDPDPATLKIGKNRDGEQGVLEILYLPAYTQFVSVGRTA